jgi:glycosyltransferase involved in cell wall biosynthesis
MVIRQRAGIRRSVLVYHPWRGMLPANDALLDEIGVADEARVCLPNIDIGRVRLTPPPPGPALKIFNGARLNWMEPMPPGFSDQDHKGTDRLLLGFAKFLERGGQGQLTLVEKGLHVVETRALAHKLGIDRQIVWSPELTMSQFYEQIEASHVVSCNLGKAILGQASLSGMAAGRPVLANFGLDQLAALYPEAWPVCDARTADEVAEHLWTLYQDPERRRRIGAEARRFAEANLSSASAARTILARLASVVRTASLEAEVRRLEAEKDSLLQRLVTSQTA